MSYWIVPLRDKVAELKQEPENSKQFYSKHLRRWGISCFQQWILQIEANIGDVIKKNYCEAENEDDLKTFIDFFSKAEEITEQILSNLYKIICDNTISELADLFIQLYREGYSDIACILTTLLEADMYENAFQKSIPFQYDKDMYQDVFQKIRSLLVAESISSIEGGALSPELREKWKLYAKKLEAEIMEIKPPEGEDSKNLDGNSTENRGQNQSSHVMIQMTEQMAMCFQTYFGECAKEFVSTLDQIKGLQTFRAELKKVLDDENHNLLCRIVTGDFPEFQDNNNNSNQEA